MSPLANRNSTYWFQAKRYGWGWGLPARREGWIVLIAFFVLQVGGSVALISLGESSWMSAWIIGLAAALVAICWWKGEPPRWRWGED